MGNVMPSPRLADVFDHRREFVACASEGQAARKGHGIIAFASGPMKRKTLQMQKQSASDGLNADGLLHQISAGLAHVIIVACEKFWHFEIGKKSLQVRGLNLDGHVASGFGRRRGIPRASWPGASQTVLKTNFKMF